MAQQQRVAEVSLLSLVSNCRSSFRKSQCVPTAWILLNERSGDEANRQGLVYGIARWPGEDARVYVYTFHRFVS